MPALKDGMRWFKQTLERRPFLRNVSIMLTGTTSGQLVSILLAPVFAWLWVRLGRREPSRSPNPAAMGCIPAFHGGRFWCEAGMEDQTGAGPEIT